MDQSHDQKPVQNTGVKTTGTSSERTGAVQNAEAEAPSLAPDFIFFMFELLHNMDRWTLEAAGLLDPGAGGDAKWTRFNNNLTTFVLKLTPKQFDAFCGLFKKDSLNDT